MAIRIASSAGIYVVVRAAPRTATCFSVQTHDTFLVPKARFQERAAATAPVYYPAAAPAVAAPAAHAAEAATPCTDVVLSAP